MKQPDGNELCKCCPQRKPASLDETKLSPISFMEKVAFIFNSNYIRQANIVQVGRAAKRGEVEYIEDDHYFSPRDYARYIYFHGLTLIITEPPRSKYVDFAHFPNGCPGWRSHYVQSGQSVYVQRAHVFFRDAITSSEPPEITTKAKDKGKGKVVE